MKALRIIAITLGYVLFFVVCTAIFVRVLFPTRQAKEFIALKLAEATGAETVTIQDLGLTGLGFLGVVPSGADIEGVQITLPGVKMKTVAPGGSTVSDKRKVTIDRLSVKAGLSGLMGGTPDVAFEADLGGGHVRGGRYSREKDGPHVIKVEALENIDLGPELLFQSLVGFDIRGKLSGKVDLTVPVADRDGKMVTLMDQLAGKVELQLADAIMLEPVLDLGAQGREQVTDVELGTIRLALTAEGGSGPAAVTTGATPDGKAPRVARKGEATVITIDEASVDGTDLGVMAAPRATIAFAAGGSPKEATLNIHLALKLQDAFFAKTVPDPNNPGQTKTPNSRFKTLLTMPPLKNNVQDGQFGIAITGTIGDAKVRTERPRTKVGGGTGTARKMNIDQPGGDEGGEGDEEKDKAKDKPKPPRMHEPVKPTTTPGDEGSSARKPPSIARQPGRSPTTAAPLAPGRPRPVIPTDPTPGEVAPGEEHPVEATPTPGDAPMGEPMPEPGAAPIEEPQPQ